MIHLDNASQPNIHNGRSSLKYMCPAGVGTYMSEAIGHSSQQTTHSLFSA